MSHEGKMFRGEDYVNRGITESDNDSIQADIDYFLKNKPKEKVEPVKETKEKK